MPSSNPKMESLHKTRGDYYAAQNTRLLGYLRKADNDITQLKQELAAANLKLKKMKRNINAAYGAALRGKKVDIIV